DVDGDDSRDAAFHVAAVLNQWTLHRADERLAVWGDRQSFHPFVRDASRRVAGDFRVAVTAEMRDVKLRRKREDARARALQPVEPADVRTVLVGDVDVPAIVGVANALWIYAPLPPDAPT